MHFVARADDRGAIETPVAVFEMSSVVRHGDYSDRKQEKCHACAARFQRKYADFH
jgi:hypothetical protein